MEAFVYPENFEEKIGFSQVREMLAEECLSATGRNIVKSISFSISFSDIKKDIGRTSEFMAILREGLPFPAQDYLDLIPVLQRLLKPGTSIQIEELHDLRISLGTISEALRFLHKADEAKLPLLREMAAETLVPEHILPTINQILSEKGNVRDEASPALAKIRKEIRSKMTASEKLIHAMLVKARDNGWTAPDAEPTLRDGRLVLPVQAAHKRRIRGLVHDESATGQTVYLEPDECFEINNEIRNLENAEKREITRILTAFTDNIRPDIDLLITAHQFIGEMDAIRAKAKFSLRINAEVPVLRDKPFMHWKDAKHPLLYLSHQQKGRKVVPLEIKLDKTNRILVISGPNAGGKSVCLKTLGLLQFMLQCGMPVPMDSSSETGIFRQLFLEIGDEQSLENDLSTYSSHLLNIRQFVEKSDNASLFLIDEFGSGTDPALGGAIAEATLEKLSDSLALGVVTTHYSNLKTMAGKVDGIINGAMLFDTNAMKPLYQLIIGNPGSSFTYEIAQKIGFPEEIIQKAIEKTGRTHLDFERQLQELELEKREVNKKKTEFTVADNFLDELIARYQKMKEELENSRKDILENARKEAIRMLEESNRLIERTIKEIRESAADKQHTKKVRMDLAEQKEKLQQVEKNEPATFLKGSKPSIKKDDWVKITGQERVGRVLMIRGNEVRVDFDGIRFTVASDQLESAVPPKKSVRPSSRNKGTFTENLNEKTANFRLRLDVRGKPAEEALQMVRKYLDDAYMLRIREVDILHGKGEGILRKVIRELLSKAEEVEAYSDEHIERGGSGITKVVLK